MELWRRKLPPASKNTYYLVLAPISRTLARAFIHVRRPLRSEKDAQGVLRLFFDASCVHRNEVETIPNRIESIARTIRQTVSEPENRLSSSEERVRINEQQDG